MSKTKTWRQLITNPTIVVFVLSLILVVFNLYLAQRVRPYTSDDISWQNTLTTWSPSNGHIADMGSQDNFLVNMPILLVMGHIFHASRTLLFIDAAIFGVINFALFYFAGLYILKKCQVKFSFETLLPFLWIASLGYNFSQLFLNSAWRDMELGVSFVFFALAIMFYYGDLHPLRSWTSRILTFAAGLVAGLFVYSDPYFLYFTVAPIVALFVVLFVIKRTTKSQLLLVIGSAVFSVLVSRVMKSAVARIGLFSPKGVPTKFVTLGHLSSKIVDSADEMTTIFGVNISGVKIFSLVGIASILSLCIIIVVAVWFVRFVLKYRKLRPYNRPGAQQQSPLKLVALFFGALYIFVFIATVANDDDNYRYFVISVYVAAILAAFVMGTFKRKAAALFTVLLSAAICINLATAVFATTPQQQAAITSGNKANAANYALIQKVKMMGLNKGYGNYWNGNVNTYLSDSMIEFLPVTCIHNETVPLRLLVDTTQFQQTIGKTFYIDDPSQTSPKMCSLHEVESQFGQPSQSVKFQKKTILIYDYDILSKMQ